MCINKMLCSCLYVRGWCEYAWEMIRTGRLVGDPKFPKADCRSRGLKTEAG